MTDATIKQGETLYVTALRRAALPGEIHGKLLEFDLQTKEWTTLLELDDALVGDNPRGWSRGFRGVVHCPETDTLWVTGFQTLFNISRDGDILERFQHPSFQHLPALALYQGKLFITSTALNLLVVFCLRKRTVEQWHWIGLDRSGELITKENLPTAICRHIHHLNAIQVDENGIFLSGANSRFVFSISEGQIERRYPSPPGSHDFVLKDDHLCLLDTEASTITLQKSEKMVWSHKVDADIEIRNDLPEVIAKKDFLRGICTLSDGSIVAGTSPLGLVCCDFKTGEHLWTSHQTEDVVWMVSGLAAVG